MEYVHTQERQLFVKQALLVCLLYLICQTIYLCYAAFSADDFWLGQQTYLYKTLLPYRDFTPYKTVLGYYIFLLPMLLTTGVWQPLLAIKIFCALINATLLFICACRLKKFFAPLPVLLSLTLLVFSQTFLSYACEIRVDMLAYWCCLFSVLLILDKRFWGSGVLLGLGFLISQKVLYYFLAMECALLCVTLRNNKNGLLLFNIAVGSIICIYIIGWSMVSSFPVVIKSVFYDAYVISTLHNYDSARSLFWHIAIENNFLLAALLPLAFLSLLVPTPTLSRAERYFILLYAVIILLCLFTNPQAFPYNKLMLLPVLVIILTAFLNMLFALQNSAFKIVFLIMLCCLGVFIPVTRTFMLATDGGYQKTMLTMAHELLANNDDYVAGVPLFYAKSSTVPGLKHITVPMLEWLYQPNVARRNLLLAGLSLDAATPDDIIQAIKRGPIKLYINNNRIKALPPAIKNILATEFAHYWGSIYLYAPAFIADTENFLIKFAGEYILESDAEIFLDGKKLVPGTKINLIAGKHFSKAKAAFRLHLIPEISATYLDSRFMRDDYQAMLS